MSENFVQWQMKIKVYKCACSNYEKQVLYYSYPSCKSGLNASQIYESNFITHFSKLKKHMLIKSLLGVSFLRMELQKLLI